MGELPLSIQKNFLRVLQEHRFRPVGARQEVESHFRLVSATNRDLDIMAETGRFRRDFLFRLRSLIIELPPLREHREDINKLTFHYVKKLSERYGIGTKGVSPEFLEVLCAYDWPGNVRELVNTLESVLASARNEPTLFPRHLPIPLRIKYARISVGKIGKGKAERKSGADSYMALPSLRDVRRSAVSEAEKQYLQDLISLNKDNLKEACRISKLSRSRLYELLKKHKISFAE